MGTGHAPLRLLQVGQRISGGTLHPPRGGLGIEENILTLCRLCHDAFDNGTATMRQEIGNYCRDYLKALYPGWDEKNLIYRKEYNQWL